MSLMVMSHWLTMGASGLYKAPGSSGEPHAQKNNPFVYSDRAQIMRQQRHLTPRPARGDEALSQSASLT